MTFQLDIQSNRKAKKYSRHEIILRIAWSLATPLFRFSPRPFFSWRSFLIRLFGAEVGDQVHLYPSVRILMPWNLTIGDWTAIGPEAYIYNPGKINLGSKVTISHRAHLCSATHDYTQADMPLIKSKIKIGDQAWICADAFIGPDVTIGEGAIAGARAVVVSSVEPWVIVAGNPAKLIGNRLLDKV